MINNYIKLLLKSTNDLVYEFNSSTKTLKWHNNINKYFNLKNSNDCFEEFYSLITDDSQNEFLDKKNSNKDFIEIVFFIKDKNKKIRTFSDSSFKFIHNKQSIYIGTCKDITENLNYKLDTKNITNIIDSIDDFIFYKDLNFRYIECNKAFCNYVNRKKEQIIGKKDSEIFTKDTANFVNWYDNELLNKKESILSEKWITDGNNNQRFIQTKKTLVKDKQNKPFAILGISRDLTSKKQKEKELEESKKTYIRLFEANKVPVLFIDPQTYYIIDANKAALKFYGYTLEEIRAEKISNINTLTKEEVHHEMHLANEEKRDSFIFKHRLKSGIIKDVEVFSGPLKYKNRKVLYSLIHDITNKVKVQKALRQANTIYQNTKEGIFITDLEGNILSSNKAFTNITGYKKEEVIGKNPRFLKSHKHPNSLYSNLWEEIKSKGFWEGEIINKNKEGKNYPQWLTINTVYDLKNNPINYIAVFNDFSKIKEQEQLLREKDHIMFQQSKMASMGEMLRNIAHQWRQPLSVISSSASGLKLKQELKLLEPKEIPEFCDGILKSAKYLSETIDDFTNFFKNQNKKKEFSIKDAINKAVQLSSASLKNNEIDIITHINDCKLYGVENEFVQVMLNIINNSKDAFHEKNIENKKVIISNTLGKELTHLSIKDNAGGIANNIMEKIFEPYFTTKDKLQGTGIGLYMSQEIIRSHLKGEIRVENYQENQDKGANFTLDIPYTI
ncbi:hypothetical protein CP960_00265 [Malaciobacter halophilus]|uniref:histidine kinase n=1 Tax=Malaciobacter halophilus TaxID=197482 RepID=A0A2N1J6Y6_9BACT|nr:PAS domain S-box protein [Malaciobacter halophilus]AXH10007.1 PAS sensor-containing signal transduction histidine kinase [Malaciobacter halophilus]PKI82222.1 hypothetical protein CP960_00265 [Malaciobacter halophilus]